MKGFNWAGDLNGQKNPLIDKFYVANATAIEKGEPVDFVQGTGIIPTAQHADFDDPIFGVSMQEKAGADGTTEVEVSYSPTAIYKYKAAKAYTLTGGSTTTAVDDSLKPDTDDFFNGGAIEIVTCAADSSLIGKIVKITDYDQATGAMTLAETLPAALASGDTIYIVPGNMARGFLGYDLTSDGLHPNYDADGGKTLMFLYSNVETMETFWKFNLSNFANGIADPG